MAFRARNSLASIGLVRYLNSDPIQDKYFFDPNLAGSSKNYTNLKETPYYIILNYTNFFLRNNQNDGGVGEAV